MLISSASASLKEAFRKGDKSLLDSKTIDETKLLVNAVFSSKCDTYCGAIMARKKTFDACLIRPLRVKKICQTTPAYTLSLLPSSL